ncbi:MAG: helix-turn-helix domain-containing protein [Alphaproteobacteria bacterium]
MKEPFLRLGLVFGAKLKYLRMQHELSLESVAARLGLNVAELSAIEDGAKLASANTLHRAATLFSCQLSDLFFWPPGDRSREPLPETPTDHRSLAQEGASLVRAFIEIPDPAMRAEILKITRFLASRQA